MPKICKRCPKPAVSKGLCEQHLGSRIYKSKRKANRLKAQPKKRQPRKKPKRKPHPLKNEYRWHLLSKTFLAENPICIRCRIDGKIVKSKHADHIKPVRLFPELAFEESNLQALCQPCHSTKTWHEMRGRIYDYRKQQTIMIAGR